MAVTDYDRRHRHDQAEAEMNRFRQLLRMHDRRRKAPEPLTAPDRSLKEPVAPVPPSRPDDQLVFEDLVASVPTWQRGVRKVAKRLARQQADRIFELAEEAYRAESEAYRFALEQHQAAVAHAEQERAGEDRLLERSHKRLLEGDPAASARAIDAALLKMPFAARLVGWVDDRAVIAVQVPGLEAVPEIEPSRTPTGKPSVRKIPKGERSDLHAQMVAGETLAAAAAALAAAPALSAVLVAARSDHGWVAGVEVPDKAMLSDPLLAFDEFGGVLGRSGRNRDVTVLAANESGVAHVVAALSDG